MTPEAVSIATVETLGKVSLRISSHFSLRVGPAVSDMPVMLRPGRAKLVTKPEVRRSGVVAMIGTVEVAQRPGHLNARRQEQSDFELQQFGDDAGEPIWL